MYLTLDMKNFTTDASLYKSYYRGTDKLRICVFYALKIVRYSFFFQKLAYKYSIILKCERIDLFMFTFRVGLFPHFL